MTPEQKSVSCCRKCFVRRSLLRFGLGALGVVILLPGCGGGTGSQTKTKSLPTGHANTKVLKVTLPNQPGAVYLVFSGPSEAIQLFEQVLRSSSKKAHYVVVQMPQGPKVCSVQESPVSMTVYSPNKRAASSFCSGAHKGL